MFFLAYYLHSIDPIAIHFGSNFFLKGIYWYGIAYCVSFLLAALGLHIYFRKKWSPLDPSLQTQLLLYLILGVLLGGRLGYFFLYQPDLWFENPLNLFSQSGMASHGGFLGVIIGLICFAFQYKQKLLKLTDIVVTLVPPGLFLGRIANFINGELWGKVTYCSLGVIFPQSAPYASYPLNLVLPRHPSQLYEAFLEGLVLGIYLQIRFWKKHKFGIKDGYISGEFLIGYGVLRIIGEYFREPDASLILGLSRGQFYSLFLLFLGTCVIIYTFFKDRA